MRELMLQRTQEFHWIWQFSNTAISFIITMVLFEKNYSYEDQHGKTGVTS
jgi:hypothetical protein